MVKVVAVELSIFSNQHAFLRSVSVFSQLIEKLNIPRLIKIDSLPSSQDLIPYIYRETEGYDFIIIGHNDSEFYNLAENHKLLDKVIRYDVDIGFGDDYPLGVMAEIFRRETLPILENIRKQNQIATKRDVFEKIIAVDVNTFDLENHYAEVSLRSLRLSFFSDNLQDRVSIKTIKSFFTKSANDFLNQEYVYFANTVLKNRNQLYTHPRYYEIAITHRAVQDNAYLPNQNEPYDMSIDDFNVMLDKIVPFAGEPVIAICGLGEMTAHQEWMVFIEEVLNRGLECIIETAGVYWDKQVSNHWLKHPQRNLLTVIFKLESVEPDLYQKIRGKNFSVTEVLDKVEYYLLRNPDTTYVETVKTTESFKHLPAFYDYFSRYTKNIIIGKYNPYRGALPERRIVPMKPYEQIDCWHLKRDLKIDARGDVWLCKQDINKEHSLGNLVRETIESIYEQVQEYFKRHVAGWDFCKNCDEFYTYNF